MRKPYKMKGSEFFGHGSDSPAKVSDDRLLSLQSKLNHSELDYREPGWAKVAKKAHGAVMGPVKDALGGDKSEPAVNVADEENDVTVLDDEVAPLDNV
jgi:hypothetical protein